MDNQCLGQERFNEPAGLEKPRQMFLLLRSGRRREKIAAAEKEPHQCKGGVIEQGADRPDEEHEPLDVGDVPFQGVGDQFLVNVVGGNAGLGKIVEEIVGQDLHRQHRQKRQKAAGPDDAEHIAEIRA